jgi:hypothetical protein
LRDRRPGDPSFRASDALAVPRDETSARIEASSSSVSQISGVRDRPRPHTGHEFCRPPWPTPFDRDQFSPAADAPAASRMRPERINRRAAPSP